MAHCSIDPFFAQVSTMVIVRTLWGDAYYDGPPNSAKCQVPTFRSNRGSLRGREAPSCTRRRVHRKEGKPPTRSESRPLGGFAEKPRRAGLYVVKSNPLDFSRL